MSFYLTGNPVPSASMPDVHDNVQNLDFALNEITSTFWTDRLGRRRMSWVGIESAFTMKLTDFESRFDSRLAEQESVLLNRWWIRKIDFSSFLVTLAMSSSVTMKTAHFSSVPAINIFAFRTSFID